MSPKSKMQMRPTPRLILSLILGTGIALALSACELSDQQKKDAKDAGIDLCKKYGIDCNASTPSPSPSAAPTNPAVACYSQRAVQPRECKTKAIDVLFVTDTSGSMQDNRRQVAENIEHFVAKLPRDVSYQFGVMVGHGSKSKWVGNLYRHASGGDYVFSSEKLPISSIKNKLRVTLTDAEYDYYSDGGEEGLYSFSRALDNDRLPTNKSRGFFRSNAGLAVVFISDENDICAQYPAGVEPYYDMEHLELPAKQRDCAGISPESVLAKTKAFMGDRPFLFGAIVNTTKVPYVKGTEDEYGYGYMDLVQQSKGVSVDIRSNDYSTGLAKIGDMAARKLQLQTIFPLEHGSVDPASIEVSVDGSKVAFTYDADGNKIQIGEDVAGESNSVVDIHYCEKAPAPSPTPSETATPSPTPTDTVTPSPTPSETVTPSPTPSETVTPSPTPSETVTPSPTPSETVTPSPTPSETVTPSPTPSETVTPSPTPSETVTPSPTPTVTTSPSPTPTVTTSPSPTPTVTTSPSPTPTVTTSPSPTPTVTTSPSPTPTVTTSPSPTPTVTTSPSPTPTVTTSPSPSPSPCTGPSCNGGWIGV